MTKIGNTYSDESLMPWKGRAIILLDLDAFFASVEQLDHPAWRGKPVIVGGDADKRGVVSTASYEARKFGVHSALPSSTAKRLCPQAFWTHGHYDRYKQMSNEVMSIMLDESPFLQQVSIDEAFLDITPTPHCNEHPISIAQRIQENVGKLGITCSIGLGSSKSVAKVASDQDKPNGLTIVYPGREEAFLFPLPLSCMSGIGSVAQEKLHALGMNTLADVATASSEILSSVFGARTQMMQDRCRGKDSQIIAHGEPAKSVSNELSFAEDLTEESDIHAAIESIAGKVARRLRKKNLRPSTLTVKIRYGDRSVRTAQQALPNATNNEYDLVPVAISLLHTLWTPGMAVRLLGISTSHFNEPEIEQASLFDAESPLQQSKKSGAIVNATDAVRDRFGESAIQFGHEIKTQSRLTGTSAKNPEDYK